MKREGFPIITCAFLFVLLTSQVALAELYGLHWGVNEGDSINYRLMFESDGRVPTTNEEFYIVIDSLPDLSSSGDISIIGSPSVSFYWSNGTSLGGLFSNFMILPIGNWSYYTALYERLFDMYEMDVEIFDTFQVWGFEYIYESSVYAAETRLELSKFDGAPNLLSVIEQEGEDIFATMEIVRIGEPGLTLILIGAGAFAIVILAAVIYMKKN